MPTAQRISSDGLTMTGHFGDSSTCGGGQTDPPFDL
jgi:hypothetical protein